MRNQKKISIGTDLKHEYHEDIDKLNVKHHFLQISHQTMINRRFKDYFDKKFNDEEYDELIN